MANDPVSGGMAKAFTSHPRNWRRNRYVYPVCSRRSGGLSIGINLNPDRACNFDCVYCQVDRKAPPARAPVDLEILRAELADMLAEFKSGRLLDEPEFADLPAPLRRLNDIAFSGDGEPTASPLFAQAVQIADEVNADGGTGATLVLITNATLLDRPAIRSGLELLHRHAGEIWGKLEAGTERCFRRIARTRIPLTRVIKNLTWAARRWPIVIQSCFMRLDGQGPAPAEIAAYCDRLAEIIAAGGRIKLVQVCTLARPPAEAFVTPLRRGEVDAIVREVSSRLAELTVLPFYGPQ